MYACTVVREDAKKTEAEETIVFFVTFLSLVSFRLGGGGPPEPPSGYAYVDTNIKGGESSSQFLWFTIAKIKL